MHQLVGCSCVRCQRTVSSIIDSVFCPACGNPVHVACMAPVPEDLSKCQECGGDAASNIATEVRRTRQAEATASRVAPSTDYATDWQCPRCDRVNPAGARVCDCGFLVEPSKATSTSAGYGWLATYQLVRLCIGAVVCGLIGIGLLFWELSEPNPSFWAIARSVLISGFGFGLLAVLIRLWLKTL